MSVKNIIICEAIFDEENSNKNYFKRLKKNNPSTKNVMDLKLNVDKIICSPYFSSLELAYNFCNNFNLNYNVEPGLYDVLDMNKYNIHNCHHYFKEHFTRINDNKEKNFNSMCSLKDSRSDILSLNNIHYKPGYIVSNIKYGENEVDIINRLARFLYREVMDSNYQTLMLITHQSLKPYLINYLNEHFIGLNIIS